MNFTSSSIGKCANVTIYDNFSGLAEIKGIDTIKRKITVQWINGSACYGCQVYSIEQYTKPETYSWSSVAEYKNECELSTDEIMRQRNESIAYDEPIFERYNQIKPK